MILIWIQLAKEKKRKEKKEKKERKKKRKKKANAFNIDMYLDLET